MANADGRCGWKSLQQWSPLMVARSGTFLLGDECVDRIGMSKVLQGKHKQAVSNREGRSWLVSPSGGLHRQNCANCATKLSCMKMKAGNSWRRVNRSVQKAGLKKMQRWRWMKKSVARRSWSCEGKSWFYNCEQKKTMSALNAAKCGRRTQRKEAARAT